MKLCIMSSVDESLAGRVGILKLLPFSHLEKRNADIDKKNVDEQIFYGCFPRIYDKDIEPTDYYPNYIRTYVERDIRNIKQIGDLSLLFKFVKLCAGRIGQLLNKASLANECGISELTSFGDKVLVSN